MRLLLLTPAEQSKSKKSGKPRKGLPKPLIERQPARLQRSVARASGSKHAAFVARAPEDFSRTAAQLCREPDRASNQTAKPGREPESSARNRVGDRRRQRGKNGLQVGAERPAYCDQRYNDNACQNRIFESGDTTFVAPQKF
jgi:hypothetical protein